VLQPVQRAASEGWVEHRAWLTAVLLGSLALRLSFFDFEGVDFHYFLSRWYDFFIEHGRWRGLGQVTLEVANYPPLYLCLISLSTFLPLPKLYAIKTLSVGCDYLGAWYVWRLVGLLRSKMPPDVGTVAQRVSFADVQLGAVATFLFLPTVAMNGAVWGQCDIMYTTGFLASLLYLLEGRPLAALVAFGFSFALKPQAIFWCPVLAGLFLSGRLPWKWLWVPVAVYAGCGVPSMLAGRPVPEVLGHWALVKNLPGLTLHAPNWYQWVGDAHDDLPRAAGVALAVLAGGFVAWRIAKGPTSGLGERQWLVSMALLSVLVVPFFLPGMHERYFFPADVLAVVYAFSAPGGWVVALLMQFASGFAYCPFLFGREPVPEMLLPLAVVLAIEWTAKDLVWPTVARRAQIAGDGLGNDLKTAQAQDAHSARPKG
jgi:Gpi18-like mannosyltransferase